jgi:hypothetical protein
MRASLSVQQQQQQYTQQQQQQYTPNSSSKEPNRQNQIADNQGARVVGLTLLLYAALATSVCVLTLLVYAAFSYLCTRP